MTPTIRRALGRMRGNPGIMVVAVVALVFSAASFVNTHRPLPSPFDPLRFPPQQVSDRIAGIDGPAVHLGADVHVTAVKCNTSGMDVGVTSVVTWRSLDPPGTHLPTSQASAIVPAAPACISKSYANPMPALVEERTRELLAQGTPSVTWQIVGLVTPLAPRSVPRTWATEGVRVVP